MSLWMRGSITVTFYELSPRLYQGNTHLQAYGQTLEDMEMNYSQRLKAARKQSGLTQAGLARLVGIDQTSISNLERGKSQGSSHTVAIAKACGVNPLWLETGEGDMTTDHVILTRPTPQGAQLVGPFNVWDVDSPLHESEVFLKFIEEHPGSTNSALVTGQLLPAGLRVSDTKKLRMDSQVIARQGIPPEQAYCVEVKGNAMEPVMPTQSTVAINTAITDIDDGRMYALAHAGQLRVRLLYRLPGGGIRLRSYNRSEHADEEYTAEECASQGIYVLGKAFWYSVLL
ncbi:MULTISPECIES: XRE family transcriptional regulator [Pseudomonas]|uniref:XRE family transcriptional regulator n=1 Tax=Pseudomonas TaxID=286 RepID=UPI0009DCD613|nr:helix-turn-helix transcriptional regulator [Pseudomonas plecoglossicida]